MSIRPFPSRNAFGPPPSFEEDQATMVGITRDLVLRRREPRRRGLGVESSPLEGTAAESLLRQLRGLELGLPPADRAFLRDLLDRVRRGALPKALGPDLEAAIQRRGEILRSAGIQGLKRLDSLDPAVWAWAAAFPDLLPRELHVDLDARRHGQATALAAAEIADRAGEDPLHAFLGGLLHDIGRPCLEGLAALAPEQRRPRPSTVAQVSDGLHPSLGAVLVESWGLPVEVQLAIEHHHQPMPAVPAPVRALAQVVRAADLFAYLLLGPEPARNAGYLARELEGLLRQLELEPDIHLLEVLQLDVDTWLAHQTADLRS